jgi:AcrR family transcriptional regulator
MSPKRPDPETQRRILESTYVLLSRVQYPALSMQTIAERAGVSKALLFYHFKSKRELARQALVHGFEDEMAQFAHLEELDETTFRSALGEMLQFSLDRIFLFHSFLEVADMEDPDDELVKMLHDVYGQFIEVLEDFLESRGIKYPREKAMLLGLAVDMFGLIEFVDDQRPDTERYRRALLDMLDMEVDD